MRSCLQLHCQCFQRSCDASEPREVQRIRRKFRRGSRFSGGSRQIRLRLRQAFRRRWPREMERIRRQCAMLGLLDRATKLTSPQGKERNYQARPCPSAPEILEPARRQLGVSDRVLDVTVAEVSLQRPRIVALVGQRKASFQTNFSLPPGGSAVTSLGRCASKIRPYRGCAAPYGRTCQLRRRSRGMWHHWPALTSSAR